MITKVTPISELIDDVDASALWAARKLERRHAWAELRALCRMLDGVLPGDWIRCTRVTDKLLGIKPVRADARVMLTDEQFVVEHADGTLAPIIPDDSDADEILVFGQIVDRCAVGGSSLSYVHGTEGCFWTHAWGISHDG